MRVRDALALPVALTYSLPVRIFQTWLSRGCDMFSLLPKKFANALYSHLPEHVQLQTLGNFGTLAELQGRHVLTRRGEGDLGPQANELPWPLCHLRFA